MSVMAPNSVTFRAGVPGLVPDAWIVSPAATTQEPPVVAVHGITRNVEEIVHLLTPRAQATGRTLVVPHFTRAHWKRYQRAACDARSDWSLLRLMTALRDEGHLAGGRFDLSGFSGGAQFAHRFTWLYPRLVGSLCATAPGWWTFPDPDTAWPYGMGRGDGPDHSFALRANLRAFLDRRIVVCVGSDDLDRDESLRQGPAIDAQQGTTRVARARRWCDAAEARARALGLRPKITLRTLQGCGHRFATCVTNGRLDEAFVPRSTNCARCQQGAACHVSSLVTSLQRTAA